MEKYVKPFLECISYKIEERLANSCTGSCPTNEGWVLNPATGEWEYRTDLVALNSSN
jgi:hypothetical protein